MVPMFLAYKPPQMLPTQTLNPTTTSGGPAKATSKSRVKRDIVEEIIQPLNKNALITGNDPINADRWWWVGVGMTAIGGVVYMYS